MGGKQKQAVSQRTKGNAKPSSSARAAELLEASGATSTGFIGFGAFSDGLGAPLGAMGAAQGGATDPPTEMDIDFALVIKKLMKRDAITKLKGMQEFGALCRDKDSEVVATVLQYWPKIFTKLSMDQDHRVREATSLALVQLVRRLHRSLAPHLRALMGPWLVAQCDLHSPAASAARAAFSEAFSKPTKRAEAVGFCRVEILAHLMDYLFDQSAQTLSDPKTTEKDEMESKHRRVLMSSLDALALYLITLPPALHETVADTYRRILVNPRFCKFGRDPAGPIRGAFYGCVGALLRVYPGVGGEFVEQLAPALLHALNEADPSAVRPLWEAVLLLVTALPDCWSKVNARKAVLPKLWAALRSGGGGSAGVIHPHVLPLISCMPPALRGEGAGFWEQLLGALRTGLSLERVQMSASECGAVVQCTVECTRYCLAQALRSTVPVEQKSAVLDFVVTKQLVPLLSASLTERSPALAESRLYADLVRLLAWLHKPRHGGCVAPSQTNLGGVEQENDEEKEKLKEGKEAARKEIPAVEAMAVYDRIIGEISSLVYAALTTNGTAANAADPNSAASNFVAPNSPEVTLSRLASFLETCVTGRSSVRTRRGAAGRSVAFRGHPPDSRGVGVSSDPGKEVPYPGETDLADLANTTLAGSMSLRKVTREACAMAWRQMMVGGVDEESAPSMLEGGTVAAFASFYARVFHASVDDELFAHLISEASSTEMQSKAEAEEELAVTESDDIKPESLSYNTKEKGTGRSALSENDIVSVFPQRSNGLVFLTFVLLPRLKSSPTDNESMRQSLLEIARCTFSWLTGSETMAVLQALARDCWEGADASRYTLIGSFVSAGLVNGNAEIRAWLQGAEFGELVVGVVKEMIQGRSGGVVGVRDGGRVGDNRERKGGEDERWTVVGIALSVDTETDGLYLNDDFIEQILCTILDLLTMLQTPSCPTAQSSSTSDRRIQLTCDLADRFFHQPHTGVLLPLASTALIQFFQLDIEQGGSAFLPTSVSGSDIYETIRGIWTRGLRSVVDSERHLSKTGDGKTNDAKTGDIKTGSATSGLLSAAAACLVSAVRGTTQSLDWLSHLVTMAARLQQVVATATEGGEVGGASLENELRLVDVDVSLLQPWRTWLCRGLLLVEPPGSARLSGSSYGAVMRAVAPVCFTVQLAGATGTATWGEEGAMRAQGGIGALGEARVGTEPLDDDCDELIPEPMTEGAKLDSGVVTHVNSDKGGGAGLGVDSKDDSSSVNILLSSSEEPGARAGEEAGNNEVDTKESDNVVIVEEESENQESVAEASLSSEMVNVSSQEEKEQKDAPDDDLCAGPSGKNVDLCFSLGGGLSSLDQSTPPSAGDVKNPVQSPLPTKVDPELLLGVAFALAICEESLNAPLESAAVAPELAELRRFVSFLSSGFDRLLSSEPDAPRGLVLVAWERSVRDGGYWSLALAHILDRLSRARGVGEASKEKGTGGDVNEGNLDGGGRIASSQGAQEQQAYNGSVLDQLLESCGGSLLELVGGGTDDFGVGGTGAVSTAQVAMEYLMGGELEVVAETQLALLMSCPDERITDLSEGATSHLALLCLALNHIATPHILATALSQIHAWREQRDSLFLFDTPALTEFCDWSIISFNIEVIRFMSMAVATTIHSEIESESAQSSGESDALKSGWLMGVDQSHAANEGRSLTAKQWDAVLCGGVSWLQTVSESLSHYPSSPPPAVVALATAACELIGQIAEVVGVALPRRPGDFPPELGAEWKDVFGPSVFGVLLPMFVRVAVTTEGGQDLALIALVDALSAAVVHCPVDTLRAHSLPPRLIAGGGGSPPLPDSLETLLNTLCPLLSSIHRSPQLAAFHLLAKLVPEICGCDEASLATGGVEEPQGDSDPQRCPPHALITAIEVSRKSLALTLHGLDFGRPANLGDSAALAAASGYLLSWTLLLRLIKAAPAEIRPGYAAWLSSRGCVERLLADLFHLMPVSAAPSPNSGRNFFTDLPLLVIVCSSAPFLHSCRVKNLNSNSTTTRGSGTGGNQQAAISEGTGGVQRRGETRGEVRRLACATYLAALEALPAAARAWRAECGKHVAGVVDRFTSTHVSPLLCARELATVGAAVGDGRARGGMEGMTVKARPAANEVVATYVKEELRMELVITLPPNMPFGAVGVESGQRHGVDPKRWRNWMLQLMTFLTYQNGSVVDGLALWKRNVDKCFEGLDDCMICFSVVHAATYALPRLQCKTCHKRFHSACLYKWFNTSHNSACPLCRNLF